MAKQFRNTDFVNLFGDPDRPIYGNEEVVPAPPSPTPSATLTPTPTITPTLTPTPTPSATPPPAGYAEANAYLEAVVDAGGTGITSSVSAATRTFFNELFTNNLYDKFEAIYPFIGGTANSHKFNAKDPRDLDAAFRITWYGGMGHDSDGIIPNGSNSFGNTHFTPADYEEITGNTSGNVGVYLRQTGTSRTFVYEVGITIYTTEFSIRAAGIPNYGATHVIGGLFAASSVSTSETFLPGVVMLSRTDSSNAFMYANGGSLGQLGNGQAPELLTSPMVIGAVRLLQASGAPDGDGGGISDYTDRPMSMVFFGVEGLSSGEVSQLTNIIDDYQVALGRNVV